MNKLFNLYVENLERAVSLIPTIQDAVKKFDGKVFNKRLENTVQKVINDGKEQTETIYFHVDYFDYKHCYLTLNFYNHRSVSNNNGSDYLPSNYETVQICNIWTDYNTWDASKNVKYYERNDTFFWIDSNYNTRINIAPIVEKLEAEKQRISQTIKELTMKVSKVSEYENKLEKIKSDLRELQNEVPYQIQDIFNMKIHASWN